MYNLLVTQITADIVLAVITVRIHTNIARYPWAQLWYLYRAFDIKGRGHVKLPLELCMFLLDVSKATIYRWLQEGKLVGAFRRSQVRDGVLDIWLGSLNKVCRGLELDSWGEVGDVPLVKLWSLSAPSPPE